jgi:hypothetical protein
MYAKMVPRGSRNNPFLALQAEGFTFPRWKCGNGDGLTVLSFRLLLKVGNSTATLRAESFDV